MNSQIPSNEIFVPQDVTRSLGRRLLLAGTTAAVIGALSIVGISYAQENQAPQTAQQEGRIGSKAEARLVARHIFFVSSGAIRWWIASLRPDPHEGLTELRRLLALQIIGLEPTSKKPRKAIEPGLPARLNAARSPRNGNPSRSTRAQLS